MHEKQWQNALETANEIIGLNYYELEKDYASIFSAQNEGNKELMFVVRAEPLADYGNHTYANILPGDYASPYGNIVEGWSGHRMPWEFYDTFDENDRRRALAQAEYTSKSGATVDLRASGDVGALPLKYGIDPEATGTWAGNDKVLDRYAEVLLFKAEALNELNGPNQGSVDLINDIRKRAFGFGTSLPAIPVFKESFDGEFVDNVIGIFSMNNYDQAGGSAWKYDVDKNNTLNNGNSLHVEVESSGTEFWTLQMRTEPLVAKGRKYSIKMKLKASKDIQFEIRVEGPLSHMESISLKAGEVKEFSTQTGKATEDQNCALFLALGNSGSGYELWIDEIEFTAMEQAADGGDAIIKQLSDFPDKESLRDWILKERGWEFWYEGKRREDLIRMGKYVETGKKYSTNFSEKNLLFPIPTSVIIENSHIEQNPHY
ncbi:RagB/SusD family nutrient uptake outer membrane protein [Bacteroides thetaiotaomicron]|nr:RagB/SusD family nutrient uptake outer membrane protein [Bacteroides thetaiotaomicron]MCS2864637.1 RagB/SusD family nutrient uptake outer membrane protein [Bacteroides thetaiotaomicron]UVV80219.1 RagB/SusD family nutrient uptake outer membrane protein [Bacteroides thetaiotaomicron]